MTLRILVPTFSDNDMHVTKKHFQGQHSYFQKSHLTVIPLLRLKLLTKFHRTPS